MEYRELGQTGLSVSRLCFGSLTLGPLQACLPLNEGAGLIRYAMERGVNFLDTAELYDNYEYIRKALEGRPGDSLIIATKTYAYSKEMAEKSLRKAIRELKVGHIDIFMLHEQENELTLRGHYEAIEYFLKAKEKGYIRSFGISTHSVEGVRAAARWEEVEVVHPIINISGLGITDGGIGEMLEAVEDAFKAGKGIYAMKPLGGGNMISRFRECFDFVLGVPYVHSIATGMQCIEEIEANIAIFENRPVDSTLQKALARRERKLHIAYWCKGCGRCIAVCKQGALYLENGRVVVDRAKCTLCGYCASRCENFCIKVV
jgi:predicted aldo/keto reductase-like oxidoreductase